MPLTESLKRLSKAPKRAPVWAGPESASPNGGITQSLLSRFLVCRERFRLRVIEGLAPADTFNHRLEYGQMWHVCEEAFAAGWKGDGNLQILTEYCRDLCRRYPLQQEQVDHWYNVCKTQFPIYVGYWAKHPDVKDRTSLLQEQVFNVPYKLPSGRVVRLRGKWDSVDLIGKGKGAGIYLQENKTKGDIVEQQVKRQLNFDLQTMLYLVALIFDRDEEGLTKNGPILGVRYNVIRRPLSGGKGSIVRHKPTKSNPSGEGKEEFYQRLGGIIRDTPEEFFMRWKVEVTPGDVTRFRRECLDPVLEDLCEWWDFNRRCPDAPFDNPRHWRHPFGVYNVLDEGGSSDLDEYLATGNEVGLTRNTELFGELKT